MAENDVKIGRYKSKIIILGIFILDKVTRLRALLDPPPPHDGVSEFTGRYPLCMDPVYVRRTSEFRMKCAWISAR